jgi:hypothetical protein
LGGNVIHLNTPSRLPFLSNKIDSTGETFLCNRPVSCKIRCALIDHYAPSVLILRGAIFGINQEEEKPEALLALALPGSALALLRSFGHGCRRPSGSPGSRVRGGKLAVRLEVNLPPLNLSWGAGGVPIRVRSEEDGKHGRTEEDVVELVKQLAKPV